MIEIFKDILQVVLFPLELLTGLIVYIIPLKKRRNFIFQVVLTFIFLLVLVISLFINEVYKNKIQLEGIAINLFGLICIFSYMIIIVLMFCKVSFREAIYCVTCTYLTEHMVYSIRIIFNTIFGKGVANDGSILYILTHLVVYILTYNLFSKQMVRNQHYTTSSINSISIMISTLFMVGIMSVIATIYKFESIHSIYALFSCFFVLYSQFKQQKELNLQEELLIQQKLWFKQKTQYEISRENIEIINRKCHDLKHQIGALRKITNIEEQKEIINSIEKSVMIYDSIIETGNDILDTVLTEKGLICSENNISMTCIADGKLLEFINIIDIYTLFGNLLDNAIEAVSKVKNKEERFINLTVQEKVGLILIQVENIYEGRLKMKNGIPMTKKENKDYHGFGIKSIFNTVEKYNGFVNIESNNQIFMIRITIPKVTL